MVGAFSRQSFCRASQEVLVVAAVIQEALIDAALTGCILGFACSLDRSLSSGPVEKRRIAAGMMLVSKECWLVVMLRYRLLSSPCDLTCHTASCVEAF